jgi:hypothetical protein
LTDVCIINYYYYYIYIHNYTNIYIYMYKLKWDCMILQVLVHDLVVLHPYTEDWFPSQRCLYNVHQCAPWGPLAIPADFLLAPSLAVLLCR